MRDSRLVLGPTMQGYMGLGAVLGAGKMAFCSRLGAARKTFWSRFRAAKKAVWQAAGTVACASPC